MRRFEAMAAAAIMAILPQAASAVVYTFHSTETSALSPSLTFDFTLDTATAITSGANTNFGNVTVSRNGTTPVPGSTVTTAFGTNLSSPLFFLVDTGLTPFYTGTGTDIRFNTGSFVIADGFTDGVGTLSIADASAAVPELSTWASLIVGLMTIGGALRCRRKRQLRAAVS